MSTLTPRAAFGRREQSSATAAVGLGMAFTSDRVGRPPFTRGEPDTQHGRRNTAKRPFFDLVEYGKQCNTPTSRDAGCVRLGTRACTAGVLSQLVLPRPRSPDLAPSPVQDLTFDVLRRTHIMSRIEPSENGFAAIRTTGADGGLSEHCASEHTSATTSFNEVDGRIAVQMHDRVISRIRGAELTLAAILGLGTVDTTVAAQLRDVLDELDSAAKDLRSSVHTLFIRDRVEPPDPTNHLTIVRSASTRGEADRPVRVAGRRYLCTFEGGQVFAYARPTGQDFFRAVDHMPWAHESDGLLLSARSGTPLARRTGNLFHDIVSNVPLYYERTE